MPSRFQRKIDAMLIAAVIIFTVFCCLSSCSSAQHVSAASTSDIASHSRHLVFTDTIFSPVNILTELPANFRDTCAPISTHPIEFSPVIIRRAELRDDYADTARSVSAYALGKSGADAAGQLSPIIALESPKNVSKSGSPPAWFFPIILLIQCVIIVVLLSRLVRKV